MSNHAIKHPFKTAEEADMCTTDNTCDTTTLTKRDPHRLDYMVGATYQSGYWRENFTVLGYDQFGYVHVEWHGKDSIYPSQVTHPRHGMHLTKRDHRTNMVQDPRAPWEHRAGCLCPADHRQPAALAVIANVHVTEPANHKGCMCTRRAATTPEGTDHMYDVIFARKES